jgi:hypothetical protein
MRLHVRAALSALAAGVTSVVLTTVRASDHLDGPRVTADPPADITDVFAFTSPENAANVVLAMAVAPYASATTRFSSLVDYAFRVRRVTAPVPLTIDSTSLDVTCRFDDSTPQEMTCAAPAGLSVRATVGDTSSADADPESAMRGFAGLRSDPAFFDRQGALATLASGRASFTGQNAFALANVLVIVVEIDARRAFVPTSDAGSTSIGDASTDAGSTMPGPTMPILAVAAETVLRGS